MLKESQPSVLASYRPKPHFLETERLDSENGDEGPSITKANEVDRQLFTVILWSCVDFSFAIEVAIDSKGNFKVKLQGKSPSESRGNKTLKGS